MKSTRMSFKLPLDESRSDLHPVTKHHQDILNSTADWEIVGVAVFLGEIEFLVFVERCYFYQLNAKAFARSEAAVPPGWRILIGTDTQIRGVSMLVVHPLIASDPDLVGQLIDVDDIAIKRLRDALDADET